MAQLRLTLISLGIALACAAPCVRAGELPYSLPRYDLTIRLDPPTRVAKVTQRVTWTNRHQRPAHELVFNAHSRYTIPDGEVGLIAKTVELLRVAPREALTFDGPALDVQTVRVRHAVSSDIALANSTEAVSKLEFNYPNDNPTSLAIPLPRPVAPGETITVELDFNFRIPPKKGRWSQWNDITALAQWLPVIAVYDEEGWHPTPFVPWHQPFYNEAGIYTARIALPADYKLACSGSVSRVSDAGGGWKEHEVAPTPLRDFAVVVSSRFQEHTGQAGHVLVRCLYLPEHDHYAKALVETACAAIPVYEKWFGPYPYPEFTIAEACFGWNGNECGGLVLIDDRMFDMPHIARGYPTYLIAHELCHQWWYNVVGTDGYRETWMDEGFATYFSHRFCDQYFGRNNELIKYPKGLGWLPNIHRDDLRNGGMIGARARGEKLPTVQELPKYGHLVNLSAAAYDRGSKVVGMIEERMGEAAFYDFMRHIYRKYQFRIIHVADYQRELEAYTGRSWEDFFEHWVRGSGMCDWSVERVTIDRAPAASRNQPVRVVIDLKQKGEFNEPTVLGIRLDPGDGHQLRVPIYPDVMELNLQNPPAHIAGRILPGAIEGKGQAEVRVELLLPREPIQITVDPDHVLLDQDPGNNRWKPEMRFRVTPVYTMLDEVEVVNSYDRWNFIAGPWFSLSTYDDPWFSRSPMAGFRIGAMRLQEFKGGAYVAYRTDDRNIIAGLDGLWDHVPLPKTQIGFNLEQSLLTVGNDDIRYSRAVVFGRYVLMYASSLYLPPFEYVETFAAVQNRGLPSPRVMPPDANPFDDRAGIGIHYHKNMLTPYWDPEGGYELDATYQYGLPVFSDPSFHQIYGQVATVKSMPKWFTESWDGPLMNWLSTTRWAFRAGGAWATPRDGLFFTLGGGEHFRGFDLRERQGNASWVGSVEWRVPVAQDVCWDFVDHIAGIRNVYLAPFYDVGNAYLNGHEIGPVAHAFGVGLRVDVTWLGLIERTMLRFDVAKTVNTSAPWQFWVGITHPF
jgi:hypothetical protein